MGELVMPILGADMDAGTLVAWRKGPGDRVARGDIVAEVETEKGLVEIEVFTTGTIERLVVEPGTKVPVGTVLALIREDGPARAGAPSPPPPRPVAPAAPAVEAPERPAATRTRISPAARQRAEQLGVDASRLAGTGPGGAVTIADVERAAATSAAKPATAASRMRQAIAAAMGRSKREIPHFYLTTTIPFARATAWLAAENATRPVPERVLPGALFVKAVALALREHPELNARWEQGEAVAAPGIHVGVAVSLRRGGLVAPAIHDTDRLSLGELMAQLRDVVNRARAGTLRSSELSDGTITVTSLGEQGVEAVIGVIFPPQVALVGFGRVVERPWVDEGRVVVAPVVTASLSADHRVTDGHRAARFLAAVERLLQTPEAL